ncbi:hypothetical protein BC941DRAFT_431832 [Chlamydoabsidia padenii]|nr:hypothetical protein BC941DRAFT_431832 [Chlamydoabsidia padenii]
MYCVQQVSLMVVAFGPSFLVGGGAHQSICRSFQFVKPGRRVLWICKSKESKVTEYIELYLFVLSLSSSSFALSFLP